MWINATSIDVQEMCQIPIQFVTYANNVWSDILPMNVDHIILGQPYMNKLIIVYSSITAGE